jgi:UDP-glucose 4-epimerase
MTRALVTGGCGFIGAALTQRLVKNGCNVMVLDDLRLGSTANLSKATRTQVELWIADLERPDGVAAALQAHRPDVLFHLAGVHFIPQCNRDPRATVAANVVGTQSLLNAMREIPSATALVIASSGAVYSPGPGPHSEEDPLCPTDIYGLTKLWNEHQASRFHAHLEGTVGVAVARLFNVFGPGETNEHLIPTLLAQAATGDQIRLGNLTTRRDYVYVEDVVDALVRMSRVGQRLGYEVFNVGSETQYSGHELLALAEQVLGHAIEVRADSSRLRSSDRPNLVSNCSKIAGALGWKPRTDLRKGLAAAAAQPFAAGTRTVM